MISISSNDLHVVIVDQGGDISFFCIIENTERVIFTQAPNLRRIALSCKGDFLASGDSGGQIMVHTFPSNSKLFPTYIAHKGPITDMMFTKYFIVSGGIDGFIRLWDFKTGSRLNELNLKEIMGLKNPIVQAIHHHCRDKRIVVVIRNSFKIYWFDYNKLGTIKKNFVANLPVEIKVVASCWDFHGIFWIGTDDYTNPIYMFFIDMEEPKVFLVDVEQDHRYKALAKHVFNGNGYPFDQRDLCFHNSSFFDEYDDSYTPKKI